MICKVFQPLMLGTWSSPIIKVTGEGGADTYPIGYVLDTAHIALWVEI